MLHGNVKCLWADFDGAYSWCLHVFRDPSIMMHCKRSMHYDALCQRKDANYLGVIWQMPARWKVWLTSAVSTQRFQLVLSSTPGLAVKYRKMCSMILKKLIFFVMRKLALTRKSKKEEAFVSSLRNYVTSIINIFMDCNIIILSSPDQKSTTMP